MFSLNGLELVVCGVIDMEQELIIQGNVDVLVVIDMWVVVVTVKLASLPIWASKVRVYGPNLDAVVCKDGWVVIHRCLICGISQKTRIAK